MICPGVQGQYVIVCQTDLRLINFRQNLCGIRTFSGSTPTLVTLLQRI